MAENRHFLKDLLGFGTVADRRFPPRTGADAGENRGPHPDSMPVSPTFAGIAGRAEAG
jgi:hypothetical protein